MPPVTMATTANPTELQAQQKLVEAQKLLDFNEKLDINMLDMVVGLLYSSVGDEQKAAQQVAEFSARCPGGVVGVVE